MTLLTGFHLLRYVEARWSGIVECDVKFRQIAAALSDDPILKTASNARLHRVNIVVIDTLREVVGSKRTIAERMVQLRAPQVAKTKGGRLTHGRRVSEGVGKRWASL